MARRYKKEEITSKPKTVDYISLIRIALSVIIVILANSLNLDRLIYCLVILAAILVAGFDIIFSAVNAIAKKDYFNYELLILVAVVAAFSAGCHMEAALLVIVYKLCKFLLDFLVSYVKDTATDYIPDEMFREAAFLKEIISRPEAGKTSAEDKAAPIMVLFAKAAVLVGVLYAIIMPLVSSLSYVASIRRGLMLFIVASPLPVIAALPISSIIGICHSAACGVFMRDGEVLEKSSKLDSVIIDKAGVVTDGSSEMISFKSPVFDNETFLKLAAHVAYNSSQRIAGPILRAFKGEIRPEIVDTFKEIPGSTMEASVKGIKVALSTKEVLDALRIEAPEIPDSFGTVLYLTVAGKYAGGMQFNEEINLMAEDAIYELESVSGAKITLLTDDNNTRSSMLAEKLSVKDYICECDTYKKYDTVARIASKMRQNDTLMFVSAEDLDYHTDASIDAKVGTTSDGADMLIAGCGNGTLPLSCLSYACSAAKRTKTIQRENMIFAVIIKLALIILAFTGTATLWFVVLADMVAALLTIINTSRISDVSIITKLFH